MSIAEEKAMRAYADHEGFFFEDERKAYVKGYEQAVKDAYGWLKGHIKGPCAYKVTDEFVNVFNVFKED